MDPSQVLLFQTIVNGLLLGGILAVISAGLSLVYGVLHIINVAYGEFIMLGAYTSYWIAVLAGVDPMFSFPLVFVIFYVVGYFVQKYVVNRIMGEYALKSLVLFFGVSIIMANLSLLTLGTEFKITTTPLSGISFWLGPISFPITRMVMFVAALGITYVLFTSLKKSWTGMAIRATAYDREAASLMGVNINKVYATTFAISTGLAALSGGLISSITSLHPTMGGPYLMYAFLISVIGGMGYLPGTLIGGFILGFLCSFINSYFVGQFTFLILFILLWILLVFFPKGIFGKGM